MLNIKKLLVVLGVFSLVACSSGSSGNNDPLQTLSLSANSSTCNSNLFSNESVVLTIGGLGNGYDWQTGLGTMSNPADDSTIVALNSGTASGNTVTTTVTCSYLGDANYELNGSRTGTAYIQAWSYAAWGYSNAVAITLTGGGEKAEVSAE